MAPPILLDMRHGAPPAPLVEGVARLVWKLRPTAGSVEDCGPLRYVAQEVLSARVSLGEGDGSFVDVFFYDGFAKSAGRLALDGARLVITAPASWLLPGRGADGAHPRDPKGGAYVDRLDARRCRGVVSVASPALLAAGEAPEANGACSVRVLPRGAKEWVDVADNYGGKKRKLRALDEGDPECLGSAARVDREHLTLRGAHAALAGAENGGVNFELNVMASCHGGEDAGADAAAVRTTSNGDQAYVTLELCDLDGAFTATLVAFAKADMANRLPGAARRGDAIRCRRVVREAAMSGDAATHLRLRGVAWTGYVLFRPGPATFAGFDYSFEGLRVHVCGRKTFTKPSAPQLDLARRLVDARPTPSPEAADAEDAGPPSLLDARQAPDGRESTVACAVERLVRRPGGHAIRLADDTCALWVLSLASTAADLEALALGAAVTAKIKAAKVGEERVFLLAALVPP